MRVKKGDILFDKSENIHWKVIDFLNSDVLLYSDQCEYGHAAKSLKEYDYRDFGRSPFGHWFFLDSSITSERFVLKTSLLDKHIKIKEERY